MASDIKPVSFPVASINQSSSPNEKTELSNEDSCPIIKSPYILTRAIFLTAGCALAGGAYASYIFSPTIGAAIAAVTARVLPVALAVLSGKVLWEAYQTIDYENPDELNKCREEAKGAPLKETILKHTWETGKYNILTQEQFTQKVREETQKIDNIPDLQKYGKLWGSHTGGFLQLPGDEVIKEWNRERLKNECASLTYDEAVRRHGGLVNILEWKLFDPEKIRDNREKYLVDLKKIADIGLFPGQYPETDRALVA